MDEMLFHGGEDDQGREPPNDPEVVELGPVEHQTGETPEGGGTSRPGDPSIEEMLRRALNAHLGDVPTDE